MIKKAEDIFEPLAVSGEAISDFTDSYASFNRIINNLQRQYIELNEEASEQNERLAEANKKLVEMTRLNLAATEFLNGILNSITAGIIAVDQGGRITHFNPAASLLFGMPLREPLGKHYRDVFPPGEPPDANALRAVETGQPIDAVEKEVALIDGTRLHLSVSTAIMRDAEGAPNGAVEVLHDLTKIQKMEREISRLNTLAALGEMAATIAHEVRNPLAAVGGFAALLKRDLEASDPRQKLISKICYGVENLNHTVTALLNYTRIEEVKREEIDYGDFLGRVIEQFKFENSEHFRNLEFSVGAVHGPKCPAIHLQLDPMLMRQLFFNLFTNAFEACNGVGKVAVTYDLLPRQKATRLYGERIMLDIDDTVVETVVTDSGPGIAEAALQKLFAPFFTTKQGGTGLGLAVVWKVLKAHGGEVFAENIPEGGARFVLLLPVKIAHSRMNESDVPS
jgi:two-component system sensor histidine kinase AtoS